MARLSDLVALMEEHRVDSGSTLNLFARRLREAGRVSKAGRGRGAASMTPTDAARFAIACLSADHPERAVDAEAVYSGMVLSDVLVRPDFPIEYDPNATFDGFVAHLLTIVARGDVDALQRRNVEAKTPPGKPLIVIAPDVSITVFRSSVSAVVRVAGVEWTFRHPLLDAMIGSSDYLESRDRERVFEQETLRFRTGKNIVASFNGATVRQLAHLVRA